MTASTLKPYRTTVMALLGLALVLAAYPLVRSFWDFEIDMNEGWEAWYQLRAMAGSSLYATSSPLMFNNYPPLSFYIVGALARMTGGDPVLAGRLLSMAALGVIAAAAGLVVRHQGGRRIDAAAAVATLLGLFAIFATDYLGMNDPQLLGQAFVLAGLAVYLSANAGPKRMIAAAALMALGVLTKHNLILVPLLAAFDAAKRGQGRDRLAFFITAIGLAAVSAAALWISVGPGFFAGLAAPRTWSVERAFLFATEITGHLHAPLAAVGLGLWMIRRDRPAGWVLAYLIGSLALGTFFAGGAGTDINIWFDVFIALAIGTGLVVRAMGRRGASAGLKAGFVLVVNAGVLFGAPLGLGRFGVDVLGEMDGRERLFRDDVAYLTPLSGPVLCQSYLLCVRAGKPLIYDAYAVNQMILAHRLPEDTLLGKLRGHEYAVVQISDVRQAAYPGEQTMPNRFVHFPDAVFDVLDQEYVLDRVGISGRFYRPKG